MLYVMLHIKSADVQKSHLWCDTLLVMCTFSYGSLGGGMCGHGMDQAGSG